MEIDRLKTYSEIIEYLKKEKRTKHLLLGNGFSMDYDRNIFSYNALNTFIEKTNNPLLQKMFKIINTKNFEQIMLQLDNFCEIANEFSNDKNLVIIIRNASSTLKNALIEAVKELHPEHVFKIPEENSNKCYLFLGEYLSKEGMIFSTNYDLLLYWVLIRHNSETAIDGFGRELENTDKFIKKENLEYSDLCWGKYKHSQTIYYLHGALPIFDTGVEIIKEVYDSRNYLLRNIKERMKNKNYPIFVTAGNAKEKLNHIMHNKYLSFRYDKLSSITGSLITFGFNFGDYDTHIIEAINKASKYRKETNGKLYSVYIGVYTDNDLEHINKIKNKFKCKINLYNARTTNIWR
jgi:hypothetical protein